MRHSEKTQMNSCRNRVALMCTVAALVCSVTACDPSERAEHAQPVAHAAESDQPQGKDHSTITAQSPLRAPLRAPLREQAEADRWTEARYATAGTIAATEQRKGDPEKGRQALLNEAYVSCGLPERVYRQLLGDEPVVSLPERSRRAEGLPYDATVFTDSNGVSVVSNNCLTCHAAPLFGELVVGLGNEFLDFTGDASALVERAGALVQGAAETRSWEKYADRVAAIAPYIRPHTVGANPANNLTFALIAHRQADNNAWSEEPLLKMPPTDPPPVSVPPWWRMGKKPAMFNLGEGRGDHARIMMAASMLCTDSPEELARIDAYAADIRAYLASLEPPAWPFAIDTALAQQGKVIFEATCSRCHGTYGPEGQYPARLVPIAEIQTDPVLMEFALGDEGAPYIDWFNRSYYGELSIAAPGPGYLAPPLDGVWATAPYLHNGSVPTISSLLNSPTRPALWQFLEPGSERREAYDTQALGWRTRTLPAEAVAEGKPATVYDTRLPGYSNAGHYFGDHLNEAQRAAVIEYVKQL